jgi:DNA replication protein DnaT
MSEWIKTETHIHEKVEVAMIAEHTGLDLDAVVGKLVRVWAWASRNCYADGVTDVTALRVIREITRCDVFDEAMVKCGWLTIKGDKITFANFDRHNSQSAKERALASRRMAKKRSHGGVTPALRSGRNKNVTRGDKNNNAHARPAEGGVGGAHQFKPCV